MPAPYTTAPDLTAATRAASRPASEGAGSAHGATHLTVDGVSKTYGDRRVLSDISFSAKPGDRIGLIGENGTGKSTLLGSIAAAGAAGEPGTPGAIAANTSHARIPETTPDSGTVTLPGSVGLLRQQLPYPDATALATVLDDAQRAALDALTRIERLGARFAEQPEDAAVADAYARALEDAEQTDAWSTEARRGEILTGLGLGGISERRPIGELSGGQRLRLSLAALLLEAPQTLLLDEPSNHLDDASAAYLERVLSSWPGIVIVASHDRALLDAVTTRILDLDALPLPARVLADAERATASEPVEADSSDDEPSTDDTGSGFGIRLWGVGYSAARAARQAEMQRWRARYAAETVEREELLHEIEVGSREVNRKHESKSEAKITRKFYADKDARVTARRARNARVRLEALERERVRRPPEPLRFRGFGLATGTASREEAQTPPPELIRADRVALAGRLREISLKIEPGGRIMLTGPNGAGKSTLLAILAGRLDADRGELETAPSTRVGYLPQEAEFADPDRSAERVYVDEVGFEIADAVPLTATGLLAQRDIGRPVGALSVGQRRRLALAALVADPPDLLLLDEPTNHLSLTLVEEFEEALREFTVDPESGTGLVIATHDRWLRSRWEGEVLRLTAP